MIRSQHNLSILYNSVIHLYLSDRERVNFDLGVMLAFKHGHFSNKCSPTGMVEAQLRASVDVSAITGPVMGN